MTFRVLFVCTGNVCRSPAAQLIFAQRAAGHDIAHASAGTFGLVDHEVDAPTALVLKEIGIDPSTHSGRRLSPAVIRGADLVLTATTEHLAAVVREVPDSFRRTFTMREFARLGADLELLDAQPTSDDLRERVVDVAEQRGHVDPPEPGQDDIGDPFGAGPDVARACVLQIEDVVEDVVQALGLRTAVRREPEAPTRR